MYVKNHIQQMSTKSVFRFLNVVEKLARECRKIDGRSAKVGTNGY